MRSASWVMLHPSCRNYFWRHRPLRQLAVNDDKSTLAAKSSLWQIEVSPQGVPVSMTYTSQNPEQTVSRKHCVAWPWEFHVQLLILSTLFSVLLNLINRWRTHLLFVRSISQHQGVYEKRRASASQRMGERPWERDHKHQISRCVWPASIKSREHVI